MHPATGERRIAFHRRTGGPCKYTGRDMKSSHRGMNITDAQFNALVEDLVKTLDKFKVPAKEKGSCSRSSAR